MVEGLAEIVLWVADMEASLEFYAGQFGLEVMSPPEMPNKFLMVSRAPIPEMVVLVPHPHAADYFPRRKVDRVLHHLAFRVERAAYDHLQRRLVEAGIEVRHGVHPVLKGVRTFYVDDPDGNEVEVIGPA